MLHYQKHICSQIGLDGRDVAMTERYYAKCGQCRCKCWPEATSDAMFERIDANAVVQRRRVVAGERVQLQGEPFKNVIAICRGSLRTSKTTPDGREQVTGIAMRGEFVGLDGLAQGIVEADAVALSDAEVRVISFAAMEEIAREFPMFQRHIFRLMGTEMEAKQRSQLELNHLPADGRVASVLVRLSQPLLERGHAQLEFELPMTRIDLGSLVSLSPETVSRALTRMQEEGVLEVDGRQVRILDHPALVRMASTVAENSG